MRELDSGNPGVVGGIDNGAYMVQYVYGTKTRAKLPKKGEKSMAKRADKFAVGDTAWLKGDPFRRPVKWVEYRVKERTKTGYVIQKPGEWMPGRAHGAEKVSTVKMNRDYRTTQEKEDSIWSDEHRYRISHKIQDDVDAATLRKVAELIGYKAEGAG